MSLNEEFKLKTESTTYYTHVTYNILECKKTTYIRIEALSLLGRLFKIDQILFDTLKN